MGVCIQFASTKGEVTVSFDSGQPHIDRANSIALALLPLDKRFNQVRGDACPSVQIVIEVTWCNPDAFQKGGERRQIGFLPSYRFFPQAFLRLSEFCRTNVLSGQPCSLGHRS